ncbi:MAG TPA: outer membrane beta-barrel protein [Paracoccus solventivorans]|uniref:outer membrane protein n=1 Tax=Paracoccus solventivorans TaxID=53463 RepID=UPI002C2254AE|nr:outer membrane beta-barrel protein [Paracoccus solventivorans]HMM08567.1 outer membrane beta-barrel protein [Paracoccus solventivorans]
MNNKALIAALIFGGTTTAMAGGYTAPVVEAEPVVAIAPALASDWTGFYGGVQIGGVDLSLGLPDFGVGADGLHVGADGHHYGLHAGYLRDYGQFVAGAELSYDKADDFDLPVNLEGELIRAKLLAGYDSGKFLPYAAISFARLDGELEGESWDGTGFGYGAGAKFMATPRFMLGIEWMTNEFDLDVIEGQELDLDFGTISLSASYRF